MTHIKKHFSIFHHHPNLVYLDSAASTQTPQSVLDAMNEYYTEYRANIHRGMYELSAMATQKYEGARGKVARLINAEDYEIVFNAGATHGLNHLAYALGPTLAAGDNIVLTRMEHHANIVPWLQMKKMFGFEIRYIELQKSQITNNKYQTNYKNEIINLFELDVDNSKNLIDEKTKIISFCYVSNTLGTVNPAKEIIALAKNVGAVTIVDAAQSIAHLPIDVKDLDCDFLVFSGHKIYGPTGIGVLYGKRERLEKLEPFFFGGDMITEVTYESASWAEIPARFEGGTPNIAGAIGLGAAVDFVQSIGFDDIMRHEMKLTEYALAELQKIEGLKIIGLYDTRSDELSSQTKFVRDVDRFRPPAQSVTSFNRRLGVISFTINNIHPHDIASILDTKNVAIRVGHHCTMPLMRYLKLNGTARASIGVYNIREDVDWLVEGLKYVIGLFVKPDKGNSKLQITNTKQISINKFQI